MSEETKNQEQQGTEVNENETTSTENNTSNDVSAQLEEMKAKLEAELSEQFKSQIAGLDRKNSELQKIIKEKEMSGKTEAEKNEMLRLENEKIQKEIADTNLKRVKERELYEANLPLEMAKRIQGEDEANVKEDIRTFNEFIDKLVNERVTKQINEKMGGKPPEAGKTPDNNILSLDEIQKLPTPEARLKALKAAGYSK